MTALALLIAGVLAGLLTALAVARIRRATRKTRATLRRWARTRLTITQAPRKAKARKGARR
ncbi:hypothetical protein [Nocardiopsis sp. YSL2]|uniref:hypothetical protein n=1 Tax=Nocardiopsis sp. YSL2 TaxID=2939492 RepID=UPI0026F45D82|nr:hypothetical protein [Nocardiopsis sp. YSL2]